MKKFTIVLHLLLFCSLIASAQNWAPIHQGDQYYYKYNGGTESELKLLQVDSVAVVNGDSVLYLNKVLYSCPTCYNFNYCDTLFWVGQFLEKTVTKKQDNSFELSGRFTHILKPQALLNESWIFDTAHAIVATVIDLNEQQLYSELDSVKTIQLSDGKIIRLSKNHGVLSSPDFLDTTKTYELVGMPSRGIGINIPDYKHFYNYHTGDILQYYLPNSTHSPNHENRDAQEYQKLKVLGRIDYTDSIVYLLQRQTIDSINSYFPSPDLFNVLYRTDTIFWKVDEWSLAKALRLQHSMAYIQCKQTLFPDHSFTNTSFFYEPIITLDSADRVSLNVHYDNDYIYPVDYTFGITLDSVTLYDVDTIIHCFKFDVNYSGSIKFKEGIGLQHIGSSASWFHYNSYTNLYLIGSVINHDTIGTILPDSIFIPPLDTITQDSLNPPQPTTGDFVLLPFPNPVTGELSLTFDQPTPQQLILDINNSIGQLVCQQIIDEGSNSFIVDMSSWPHGYYFIRIHGHSVKIRQKVFKW